MNYQHCTDLKFELKLEDMSKLRSRMSHQMIGNHEMTRSAGKSLEQQGRKRTFIFFKIFFSWHLMKLRHSNT